MAGSYFPTWRLRAGTADGKGQVIAADERLPWPQTFAMGVQHVVAMFGSTVLAPLLMGFDPNLAIFMSGMAAAALPNSRLKAFHAGIEEGKILLLVDVPFKRVPEIEELLEKRHPEAAFAGIEKHIPVFP